MIPAACWLARHLVFSIAKWDAMKNDIFVMRDAVEYPNTLQAWGANAQMTIEFDAEPAYNLTT